MNPLPRFSRDHFNSEISAERATLLFKNSVQQVEIEVFTYCNRKCWFCPNSYIDRHSSNTYMDEGMYLKVMDELASIGYSGVVTYSRYNEPLADPVIVKRIAQARARLPAATLSTHTNGDFLTKKMLDDLRGAGLDRLRVQTYLGNKQRFDDDKMLRRMARQVKRMGDPAHEFFRSIPGVGYSIKVEALGMDVTIDSHNFDVMGLDRGGTVEVERKYQRDSPCMVVFQNVYIDHDGSVVPCCNIRSDEASHAAYVVDRVGPDRTIFDAYGRGRLAAWRRRLLKFGGKPAPCSTCAFEVLDDENGLRRRLYDAGLIMGVK